MKRRILVNCGLSQANGDYSWVDLTKQDRFIKGTQYMPETAYMMQIARWLKIDDFEWLSGTSPPTNQFSINKLKESITNDGLKFLQDNDFICFFSVSSVTRLHLNNDVVFAHHNDIDFDSCSIDSGYCFNSSSIDAR